MQYCSEMENSENWDEKSKLYGINSRSIFFELECFDPCSGAMVPDVMHDLLEGTLQYEAKLILKHAIHERYFTYKRFSESLQALELGYMEADNRPTMISSETINSNDKTLGQKGRIAS